MKLKSLLKSTLLLCALIAGSTSAWGENATYSMTIDSSNSGNNEVHWTASTMTSLTWDGVTWGTSITWSSTGSITASKSYCQIGAQKNPATKVELSTDAFAGKKIVSASLTCYCMSNTGPTLTITAGSTTMLSNAALVKGTSTKHTSTTNNVTLGAKDKLTFTINSSASAAICISEIEVVYEKLDPTITFTNGSVNVGKTIDLSTLFASDSEGAVTYSITAGDSYASIDGSVLTGVAAGSVTVKAEQASAGAFNAGEASATITVNEALTLSSIAVTTAPDKTVYEEGEFFDPTGIVVTATYSNSSTDDVTALCTYTPSTTTALTLSDTYIEVSYTENAVVKTVQLPITVLEYVDYAILPFNWEGGASSALKALKGVTTSTLDSDYAASHAPYLVKFKDTGNYIVVKTDSQPGQVTVGIKKIGGANASTLTIQESSDGENYTDVEELYTSEGAQNAIVSLSTTKLFKADSRYVRIYFTKSYGGSAGSNIGVGPISITKTTTLTLASACTDGDGNYYGTFSFGKAFVVPEGLTVSTIEIEDGKLVTTDFAPGEIVKANYGVLVSSTTAGNKTVALSAETGIEHAVNLLKPSGDAGITASNMATAAPGCKYYRLTMHNGSQFGFWWGAGGGGSFDIAANKAYLAVPSSGGEAREGFTFGEDVTTGISEECRVKSEEFATAVMYDLQGRRVEKATKGLYIRNGRKVFVK